MSKVNKVYVSNSSIRNLSQVNKPYQHHKLIKTPSLISIQAVSHGFLWCFVVFLHILSCGFLSFMAYAHYYLAFNTQGYDYIRVLLLYTPIYLPVAVFGTIAVLHCLQILVMFYKFLHPFQRIVIRSPNVVESKYALVQYYHIVHDFYILFGVNGPYYEIKLAIKHIIIAGSQTFRAYKTSVLVGVSSINSVFSILLFVYGVVIPIFWKYATNVTRQVRRRYTIFAAVSLNFSVNVLLPSWILAPYYNYFEREDQNALTYEDTFYPIGVSVCQSILMTSFFDVVITGITHVFLWTAIMDFLRSFHGSNRQVEPSQRLLQMQMPGKALLSSMRKLFTVYLTTLALIGYVCSISWALAVVSFNYTAIYQETCQRGCLAQTYPWLTGKCACTVLETTCDENGFPELPLDSLEPTSLVFLIISHCPSLVMTPSIQHFNNLIGIEIYNTTITTWGIEANIESFSRFSYAQFVQTNMSELPLGLFYNAPDTFLDFELSITNLSSITLDASYFSKLSVLYIEHGELNEFPAQFIDHPILSDLSFLGNNIGSVPPNLSLPSLNYLQLSSNPVVNVDEMVYMLPNVWEIYLDSTHVGSFPNSSNAYTTSLYVVGAYNSTFCNEEVTESCDCSIVSCEKDAYTNGYLPVMVIQGSRANTSKTFV
ncbi:hypothetical protein THRCLA_21711 [Thraustotheca clavata]|uniref:LNR domain-containing protein n=1 Tax=Thraustotheca clavata TaxID=74557 RepID=A0A1V9ZQI3_9STRA|nr:hypothetical protein THRCLA_21711 [Thraustotheca clavata]